MSSARVRKWALLRWPYFHRPIVTRCMYRWPTKAIASVRRQRKKSYLNMDAILTVARACGVEAIHPGYGLLSENPTFAKLCEEQGIRFIGAPYEVMLQMGR